MKRFMVVAAGLSLACVSGMLWAGARQEMHGSPSQNEPVSAGESYPDPVYADQYREPQNEESYPEGSYQEEPEYHEESYEEEPYEEPQYDEYGNLISQ